MKCCRSACLILGDLNDVRAMESCSLLIGDCYVLQGRPWPSLTEYAQVLDSARLRSDWRVQLSALFGQAFVHFIGRDWKSASAAVGLCESLVTDIVAALDSATVITVRSFILLAEISQYKVDMNVLHSTIDMILGTPTSSSTSTHARQRDSSNAAGITPLIPISLLNTDSNAARNSDSTIINNNNNNNNNMNDINDTKLQQKNDHNISTADGGAFVDAGRAFQYHHRALFVYYAIIMSSLTILESSKFDIRKEKEKEKEKKIKKSQKMKKEKNMKYNTLDANS